MKFVDEAVITAQSGNGGSGCVSFRRERFVPRGGPDGGDGGKGGDVILEATDRRRTLYPFRHRRLFRARNGTPGQGKCKSGKNGEDLVIEIPAGTLVFDADSGDLIEDFVQPGQRRVLLKGGRGGRGNHRFRSATHQAPRFAQPGEPGSQRIVRLELKLLADVGLVGLPNAGKSTLIAAMSAARPKIADYPFTTLTPNLGVVQHGWGEPFVVADIPGLIEGAHAGSGLGIQFLRHVERTRLLVHLVDVSAGKEDEALKAFRAVCRELTLYDPELAEKPQVVVLNKIDLPETGTTVERFRLALNKYDILAISALTGQGVDTLIHHIAIRLDQMHESDR
ncbi:MAG: GTPase ObgE [Desulfobacteraceae bacterium]|nr:GTPase ObgE [Desulfobacteraceae bacterium]